MRHSLIESGEGMFFRMPSAGPTQGHRLTIICHRRTAGSPLEEYRRCAKLRDGRVAGRRDGGPIWIDQCG